MMKAWGLMIAALATAACAESGADSVGINLGWDQGASFRWRFHERYWAGAVATVGYSHEKSTVNAADPGYGSPSSIRSYSGETVTGSRAYGLNFVLEAEHRLHGPLFINPFLSTGFQYDMSDTDPSASLENYSSIHQETNRVALSIGVAPTVRVGRLEVGLKYGVAAIRSWGEESSSYSNQSDGNTYYRKSYPESTRLTLLGSGVPNYMEFSLHWLF